MLSKGLGMLRIFAAFGVHEEEELRFASIERDEACREASMLGSRGALRAGGHFFAAPERQPSGDDDGMPPPPSLEEQIRRGLKRTYTMYLANYGQRPEAHDAVCGSTPACSMSTLTLRRGLPALHR